MPVFGGDVKSKKTKIVLIGEEGSPQRKVNVTFTDNKLIIQGKTRNTMAGSWYWALNGIFGVLFSALAVFFSIYFGIATNFYIGVACYTILLTCLPKMYRAAQFNQ